MIIQQWISLLSGKQRLWLVGTVIVMILITGIGIFLDRPGKAEDAQAFTVEMSISDIAPALDVTGKALARELGLPLDVSKARPLRELGVKEETLQPVVHHLLSHRDSMIKYYLYAALVIGAMVFLVRLGRPDGSDIKHRSNWYPRAPYVAFILTSVTVAGFLLGKSPNPMEGIVKVFKSMVGLYPDPMNKVIALVFFLVLAVIGNKLICGWACPFGALEELIYSMPVLKKFKRRKLPFAVTNTVRIGLFAVMMLFLFGIVGGKKGTVIYHGLNPFNLFNLEFEMVSILVTVIVALTASFFVYRPFCQFICPFGLVSWIAERVSIFRVRINREKCTECGACIKACPLEAAKGRVEGSRLPADCFSCARCLNVCSFDAIEYGPVFRKND